MVFAALNSASTLAVSARAAAEAAADADRDDRARGEKDRVEHRLRA
jgi:Arc/MetJ family transcription regulator